MTKLRVGLTGGIGSGKTLTARYFNELGIDVIDADKVARDVVARDSHALLKITKRFGEKILTADGALNRTALREHIFKNTQDRHWLEKLLHPLIRQQMATMTKASSSPYCILAIPLLIENLPNPLINRILVIDCSEAQQLKRIMARDQLDLDTAKRALQAQISRIKRLEKADDVIKNNADQAYLKQQVNTLHKRYLLLCDQYI